MNSHRKFLKEFCKKKEGIYFKITILITLLFLEAIKRSKVHMKEVIIKKLNKNLNLKIIYKILSNKKQNIMIKNLIINKNILIMK